MVKEINLTGFVLIALTTAVPAQDTARVKTFDYSKFKPVVHLFANAEYNPSAEVSKDYSFWIGRAMIGFQYQFDPHWSGKVLIDRTRLTGSMNTMYLKVATLRWAPNDRVALEAGAVNQNNYIPFETFWGYRFVAETFQDRYYQIPSSDLGIIAYFRISGRLSLDIAVTNGEGPRIDQDNFGKIRLAGGLNFNPSDKFRTRVFYQLKQSGEPGLAAEQLFNGYAGYQPGKKVRFGAEFTYVSGFLNNPSFKTYGCTAFGCVTLYKTLNFLARYDRLMVSGESGISIPSYNSQNALITGFSLSPVKGIILCLNYQGSYRMDKAGPAGHRILWSFEYKI